MAHEEIAPQDQRFLLENLLAAQQPAPAPAEPPAPVVQPPLPNITIDAKSYPCDAWELVEKGERLEKEWKDGFKRGGGQYREGDPQRFYYGASIDTTMPPYIRVGVGPAATFASLTSFNSRTAALLSFLIESPDGTDFVYLLSGRYGYKIKLSDNSVNNTKDFGAGAVCGRPALFEGNWYIPLGASVEAVELTTVANSGADTFNTMNVKALAFANLMKDGIAQLARAHTTNLVDLAAAVTRAASDWAGDDFEVGDSSLAITDMVTWKNELAIIKPDSVYRFDADGAASPVQDFVGRSLAPLVSREGAGFNHGPYFYWPHSTGLWRLLDDGALPIGPEAATDYVKASNFLGSTLHPVTYEWKSFVAWGRWAYASIDQGGAAGGLFVGYIQEDGTVLWHTDIHPTATRLTMTEGGSGGAPILWVAQANNSVTRYNLTPDGSLRDEIGGTGINRGPANLGFEIFMSWTDLAGGQLPSKLKQGRRIWIRLENTGASSPLQLRVFRDDLDIVASEQVGSDVTSNGYSERTWTPGTNDTFYELMLHLKIPGFSPAGGDVVRIVSFGIEAVTASTYQLVIPLIPGRINGNRSADAMLKDLRALQNGAQVTIREAGKPGTTFSAQIVSVAEQLVPVGIGLTGYIVQVHFERFDYADGV